MYWYLYWSKIKTVGAVGFQYAAICKTECFSFKNLLKASGIWDVCISGKYLEVTFKLIYTNGNQYEILKMKSISSVYFQLLNSSWNIAMNECGLPDVLTWLPAYGKSPQNSLEYKVSAFPSVYMYT